MPLTRRRLLRDGGAVAVGFTLGGSLLDALPTAAARRAGPLTATEIIGFKGDVADFDFSYSPVAAGYIERPNCDDWNARFAARCARAAGELHRDGKKLYCFVQFRQRNVRPGGVAHRELGFVATTKSYGARKFDRSITRNWMGDRSCRDYSGGPGDPGMRRVNNSLAGFRRKQARAVRAMLRDGDLDGFFVDQQGKLIYELGTVLGFPGYRDMPIRDTSASHAVAYQRLIAEIRDTLPARARLIGNSIDGVLGLGLGPHGMSEALGENFTGREAIEADPVGHAMDYVLDPTRRAVRGYRFWGFDRSASVAVCRQTYLIAAVFDWGYMHTPCADGPFVPDPEPGPPLPGSRPTQATDPVYGTAYRSVTYRHFRDATVVVNAAQEERDVLLDDGRRELIPPREVVALSS